MITSRRLCKLVVVISFLITVSPASSQEFDPVLAGSSPPTSLPRQSWGAEEAEWVTDMPAHFLSGVCNDDGTTPCDAMSERGDAMSRSVSDCPLNCECCETQSSDWLRLNVCLTDALLDFQNRQTDKELFILRHRGTRHRSDPQVIVGGQSRLSFLAATTNTTDKFPYLGRFPTDFHGDTATDVRMLQSNAHATAHITPYASVYTELLFSDVFSFADHKQGSLQVRQAYAVIGDLRISPYYLYLGKKTIGFGDFGTLSPFTQSVVWHYFAALGEGIGAGYHDDAWDFTIAGINGGRGIRVADSTERGKLNNLAVNMTYHVGDSPDLRWQVGGGYLLGTIYDGFTAEHLDANQFGTDYNSAWTVNTQLDIDRITLAGEFVTTTRNWPVTASRVAAYRTEAAYWFDRGPRGSQVSASWSSGEQGPSGSEFEFNNQLVIGYGQRFGPHCRASVEYVRSLGFAPLINITTVSDRDVAQDSLVLGLNLIL